MTNSPFKRIYTLILALLLCAAALLSVSCGGADVRPAAVSVGAGRRDVAPQMPPAAVTENGRDGELTLVMVGDVLMHTPVSDSGLQEDGSYNYDHLFANVRDEILKADLALVNQEVILGGKELGLSGYPNFNAAYEVGDSLIAAGFDVVLHATNHALDKGRAGIMNCLSYWQGHPEITVTGINDSAQRQKEINILTVNGIRLAVLNYTYGTNGIPMPADMPFAVNLLDRETVTDDIARAREQADFVIVCPHWGTEYIHTVSKDQEYWAQLFASCNADLVIGTHPHVIEPVREYTRADGKMMPVYFSLGNFINSTAETGRGTADRMLGAMARVTLRKGPDGAGIVSYEALPLVTHMQTGRGKITTYFLSDYTEELAQENEIRSRDSSFSLDFCRQLWESVIPADTIQTED